MSKEMRDKLNSTALALKKMLEQLHLPEFEGHIDALEQLANANNPTMKMPTPKFKKDDHEIMAGAKFTNDIVIALATNTHAANQLLRALLKNEFLQEFKGLIFEVVFKGNTLLTLLEHDDFLKNENLGTAGYQNLEKLIILLNQIAVIGKETLTTLKEEAEYNKSQLSAGALSLQETMKELKKHIKALDDAWVKTKIDVTNSPEIYGSSYNGNKTISTMYNKQKEDAKKKNKPNK